ncbi:protein phosphatase 1 regulatory subunit 3G-like [Xenopus laevis]|uniref:Protein phosphatase 1 regulatory subunit 3G-like n=1 Tax=Xenopus laevis TaxID=8355 RepID=A0A8J1KY30_XENLA|nr:protein phosphatase 1 regulatory subunit 3G-like [Xenopus laevis]
MDRPAPQQRQDDLHPALYHFEPGQRLGHSMGAESRSNVRQSEGHYVPAFYERCDNPLMVDTTANIQEAQLHLAERDEVEELQERMCELRVAREGERGAHTCGHHFGHQEYTDTDIVGSESSTAEGSARRRALSLPVVQQCHSLGVAGAEEDCTLLCCCKLKKKVQFADSLGLCLASVKHFLPSEEPLVPPSVLARLQSYPPTGSLQRADFSLYTEPDNPLTHELRAKVEAQGVCLEQASDTQWGVRGCALVRESEDAVQVKIRYTFNDWLSHLDCPAADAPTPAPGPQRFPFTLCYPPATARVQFAICCNLPYGRQLWDNNQGLNYIVCCHQEPQPDFQASHMEQDESCIEMHW